MKRAAIVVFAVAVTFGACEGAKPTEQEPAGPDGGYIYVHDAASLPTAEPVTCGADACGAIAAGSLFVEGCCLDAGGCGRQTPYAGDACVAPDQPGNPDLACPGLSVAGGPLLQGCCDPSGTCGVLDRFGDIGCITVDLPGRDPVACEAREGPACRQIVEVNCDGAEDCGLGLECCARVAPDLYDAFGCFPSCDGVVDGINGVWVPLCHLGEPCARAGERCTRVAGLPDALARCSSGLGDDAPDARAPAEAGVACGEEICGEGQKCCLRPPLEPYCALGLASCECTMRVDVALDASVPDADASVPDVDASAPDLDASTTADGAF